MNQRDNLPADITKPQHSVQAPTFEIPPQSLINIEHPFIIQNISRAVDSLGGLSAIQAVRDSVDCLSKVCETENLTSASPGRHPRKLCQIIPPSWRSNDSTH